VELEPTTDRAAATEALGRLGLMAGTDLGDGLASATSLAADAHRRDGIEVAPGHPAPAAIVLESDGAQNRGALTAAQAALVAKKAGIRVYGIALGTPGGSVVFGAGDATKTVPAPPDPATVRAIARVTDGRAFRARTAGELAAVYGSIAAALR
jgi:Ca-activated chloride channel family protein